MRTTVLARLSDVLAVAAGWAILGLSVLILFDVVARKLFGMTVGGTDELGGYVLAVSAAFGFAYALAEKAHIRVDMVLDHISLRARAVLHLAALIAISMYAGVLLWRGALVVFASWQLSATASTGLGLPLVVPQGLWVAGLALFAVMAVSQTVSCAMLIFSGSCEEADARFGTKPVEIEVAEELHSAVARGAGKTTEGTVS